MATLGNAKLVSLKQKLEEKEKLEKEVAKVSDKIDTLVGEKKEKIAKKK
jgi:hypothetical protein